MPPYDTSIQQLPAVARTLGLVFVALTLVTTAVFLLVHKARKQGRHARLEERARLDRMDGLEAARSRKPTDQNWAAAGKKNMTGIMTGSSRLLPPPPPVVITRPQATLARPPKVDRRVRYADGGFDNMPL